MDTTLTRRQHLEVVARRVAAYFIDVALIFTFFALTQTFLLKPVREALPGWSTPGWHLEIYTWLTVSLPAWVYMAAFESSAWQATPGKHMLGLQVVGLAGERIGFGRALWRAAVKFLPWELTHLIVNLPESMWIDPQTGALSFDMPVSTARISLFFIVYALLAVYLAAALFNRRGRSIDDLAAGTLVVRRQPAVGLESP